MPNDLPSIDTTSTYALIASLIVFVVWLARKASPATWDRIPARWRWLVPVLLAAAAAFAEQHQSGRPWQQAVVGALAAGLMAIGTHHALQDSPLPYGNAALLLVLSLAAPACTPSTVQQIKTADDIAHEACGMLFARERGITFEQAAAAFCTTEEQLRPFVQGLDGAARTARARALTERK